MKTHAYETLAGDAVLLRFGGAMDASDNAKAVRLCQRLRTQRPPWLRDAVPAYASLAVFFDEGGLEAADPHAFVASALEALLADEGTGPTGCGRIVEIPVCYDETLAPDLASSAALLGLPVEQLVEQHVAGDYTVAMIGFAPGFPYLMGMPASLSLPRLDTPRTQVPAGAVAIGGGQTGIYPRDSPGGWRLIGRTPLRLFDAARASPSLLVPGDRVAFRRIDADTFHRGLA